MTLCRNPPFSVMQYLNARLPDVRLCCVDPFKYGFRCHPFQRNLPGTRFPIVVALQNFPEISNGYVLNSHQRFCPQTAFEPSAMMTGALGGQEYNKHAFNCLTS